MNNPHAWDFTLEEARDIILRCNDFTSAECDHAAAVLAESGDCVDRNRADIWRNMRRHETTTHERHTPTKENFND